MYFYFYFKYGFSSWLYICCSPFLQADLLDVVGVLYVGGLPQNYTTKRIGPVRTQTLDHSLFPLVKTEKKKHALKQTCVVFRFQILYSINGCIRNMKMVGGAVSAKSPTAGREL